MSSGPAIRIFEVGPRDGLQNEPRRLSLQGKIWFINELVQAGVRDLEVGAFVRPDRVPQMADTPAIYRKIRDGRVQLKRARAWALVPNQHGMQDAIRAGAKRIAVFTAATESFARTNIGMSIGESLSEFSKVIADARAHGMEVRGYVSTAFGCPFEGKVAPKKALRVIERLAALGVTQVSIGDTIGVATPTDVDRILRPGLSILGEDRIAAHFHDTRGTALANALRAIEIGVTCFDTSAGGLGGCPFAPSATGNLATEDLVYMLNGMGLRTGIDLDRLVRVSLKLASRMKRPLTSRFLQSCAVRLKDADRSRVTFHFPFAGERIGAL